MNPERLSRALELLRDEMRKLTYGFDSRQRMEQIFSTALATQAAPSPPALGEGWMPIETAPKRTPILATDGKVIVVLERGECAGNDWPDAVGFGGYEWEWDFNWSDLTHWMPPPAPPAPEGE